LPEVVLVPLKEATVLAPFSVVPPTELVVRVPVVVTRPAPVSPTVLDEVRLTPPPPPADMVPATERAPVLLIITLPPPVWFTPITVSGAAVFVN
jgi:hypothetical protein